MVVLPWRCFEVSNDCAGVRIRYAAFDLQVCEDSNTRLKVLWELWMWSGGGAEVLEAPQSFHDAMTFGKSCRFEIMETLRIYT